MLSYIHLCHIRSYANIRQPLCRGIPSYFSAGQGNVTGYSYSPSDLQGNFKQEPYKDRIGLGKKEFRREAEIKHGFEATGNIYPFTPR